MSKRSIFVAVIFLVLITSSALPVNADVDFDVIRPVFDRVIEEEGGVNYIRINRGPTNDDIFNARPKNSSLREWANDYDKLVEVMAREKAVKEVREEFLGVLPRLEKSAGLKFWSFMLMSNEDPPALYIGLYRPTESQLMAVAEAMKNIASSRGVIIRFYEALSPKSLEDELDKAADSLGSVLDSGQWDPEIPIPIAGHDLGALELGVNYPATGRTYPDDEYVMKVIKAVRGVVGGEIPVIFSFSEIRTELLSGVQGSQAPWLPILIVLFTLSTVGYTALRRTRKGSKR